MKLPPEHVCQRADNKSNDKDTHNAQQLRHFDNLYADTEIEYDDSAEPIESLRFIRTGENFIRLVGSTLKGEAAKSETFPTGRCDCSRTKYIVSVA